MLLELGVPFDRFVTEKFRCFIWKFNFICRTIYKGNLCNPQGYILVWHFDLHDIWMSLWDILLYNMASFKKGPPLFTKEDQLNETGSL